MLIKLVFRILLGAYGIVAESKTALPGKEQFEDPSASSFLLLLLIADFAFIFLHFLLQMMPSVNNDLYSLEKDRGYAEFYMYVKELWIIALLLLVYIKTRTFGYIAWAILFGYLLWDDALQVHERLGKYIAEALDFTPLLGLRARDFGELAVSAMAGALLWSLLMWVYMRSLDAFRRSTRHLLIFLLLMAFFGIVVDMLHVALNVGPEARVLLGVVEDGGEMVVMSFIAWYVFLLNASGEKLGCPLRSLVAAALRSSWGHIQGPPRRDGVKTAVNLTHVGLIGKGFPDE